LSKVDRGYLNTLRIIHDKVGKTDIIWAVTGSLGFALQGIPVSPHDIDIQTDKNGAYRIGDLLAEYVVEMVSYSSTDEVRSYFGVLSIGSIRCEIIGDIEKRLDNGTWSPAPDLRDHIHYVEVDKMRIPVLSLQYECQAYKQLGRYDKALMLHQWLHHHGDTVTGTGNE
jgi:hypothetical protein